MPDNSSKIWLSPPHMSGNEMKYITEAFNENWIAPAGPNIMGFENDLENYLGNELCVAALSSGTAALHLALRLLSVGAGDIVVCQSFTFAASANAILYTGATTVFVDSDADSWGISPYYLEAAIKASLASGSLPKAIIAVHLYGMPYRHDEVMAIAQRYGIPVIEDAAEALGSAFKGKPCGTLGDIGVFSFNGNKIITTSGGGALVVKNEALKKRAIFLATQAKDNAPHYEHSELGYNYRMSNVCAGIGRGQIEVIDERVQQKRSLHTWYKSVLGSNKDIRLLEDYHDEVVSNHWLNCIVADAKTVKLLYDAFNAANIECRPLWKPMHLQPLYKGYSFYGDGASQELFENGLCLPSGTAMGDIEKNRIEDVLSRVLI